MYRISVNKRKYSPTPIVEVDDKGKETIVLISTLKKDAGDKLLQNIVNFLNKK